MYHTFEVPLVEAYYLAKFLELVLAPVVIANLVYLREHLKHLPEVFAIVVHDIAVATREEVVYDVDVYSQRFAYIVEYRLVRLIRDVYKHSVPLDGYLALPCYIAAFMVLAVYLQGDIDILVLYLVYIPVLVFLIRFVCEEARSILTAGGIAELCVRAALEHDEFQLRHGFFMPALDEPQDTAALVLVVTVKLELYVFVIYTAEVRYFYEIP